MNRRSFLGRVLGGLIALKFVKPLAKEPVKVVSSSPQKRMPIEWPCSYCGGKILDDAEDYSSHVIVCSTCGRDFRVYCLFPTAVLPREGGWDYVDEA